MSRVAEAVAKKTGGRYNCAQAVACTYSDVVGLDEETVGALAAGFGAGMGCGEGTCGALSGAGLVLGACLKDRAQAMMAMKSLMQQFKARNGATVCRELKGAGTGQVLRACNDCVADAAEFLETVLAQAGVPVK